MTKAAAVACAEWLSVTHGADGIAVNCLCPQAVATNLGVTSAKVMGTEQTLANPSEETDDGGEGDAAVGGVASGDGVLTAEETAEEVLRCIAEGIFLVLVRSVGSAISALVFACFRCGQTDVLVSLSLSLSLSLWLNERSRTRRSAHTWSARHRTRTAGSLACVASTTVSAVQCFLAVFRAVFACILADFWLICVRMIG